MAKLTGGILGTATGKVSGVVAATWKDKNYVRQYVIPGNPNTAAQQVQRALMAACVDFAKLLVGQVFNAYTDGFQRSMSGFNYFVHRNIHHFTPVIEWGSIKVCEGKLYKPPLTGLVVDSGTHVATWSFLTALGNNGLDTDKIFAVLFDSTDGFIYFPAAEVTRDTGTITCDFQGGGGALCKGYLWAIQYTSGRVTLISDSGVSQVVAA